MAHRSRVVVALLGSLAVAACAGCSVDDAVAPDVVTLAPSPTSTRGAPPAPSAPSTPTPEPPATPSPTDDGAPAELLAEIEDQVFALANDARAAEGLAPLTRMPELDAVARGWSQALADAGDGISHNPDYSRQIPSGWSVSGENVGWMGETRIVPAEDVARAVHQGWMDSPGHRENLLTPEYTHLGVGVAFGAEGYYLTQNFAAY